MKTFPMKLNSIEQPDETKTRHYQRSQPYDEYLDELEARTAELITDVAGYTDILEGSICGA